MISELVAGLSPLQLAGVGAAGFAGATLAAVSGFGGAAVLLPVLVAAFGPRLAVPILTVAQLIGNGSRVWLNRRELDYRVVGWFALGGVPTAVLGSMLFANAPLHALTRLIGAFLLLIVAWRRLRPEVQWRPSLRAFSGIGAVSSLLSALVGSVGPLMAPLFLAYGLVKGAYIGTEACATVVMHVTKLIVYRQAAVLPDTAIAAGLALGPVMIAGSWVGKRIVDRIPEHVFVLIIETTMVVAGLLFLIRDEASTAPAGMSPANQVRAAAYAASLRIEANPGQCSPNVTRVYPSGGPRRGYVRRQLPSGLPRRRRRRAPPVGRIPLGLGGHSAGADLTIDAIAVSECVSEAGRGVRHGPLEHARHRSGVPAAMTQETEALPL